MINYQEIVDNLNLEQIKEILDKLKIPFKETENALIMPTACHNINLEEASWKLYYYKDNHIFYCYTECSCAMSIFKFIENVYKTRGIEYDWYNDVLLLITKKKQKEDFKVEKRELLANKFKRRQRESHLEVYSEGILSVFEKIYPSEWLDEGISKKAMDKFNIKFSISQNKIIIPHYNVNNELIGIRGRALNEWEIENIGKYLPVQIEQKWYKHPLSLNLYGLNKTKEDIKKNGYVLLFEGEKSVLKVEDFHRPNCAVAVCGSSINKFQINILEKYCSPQEYIICFDKEKENNDEYFNKLMKLGKKYSNYGRFSFIYDFKNQLDLKDAPVDKGEEIFEKLLRERIKIK